MQLAGFVARRAAGAALFALLVASISMALARLAPGDGVDVGVGIDPQVIAAQRAALGLDRPWYEQYGRWLAGVARLDLGRSSHYQRPVIDLVRERAVNTAILAIAALALATLIGVPLGRYTGVTHTWPARVVRVASLILLSIPPLIGSLLLVLIAARTGWLPVGGMPPDHLEGAAWFLALLRHLPVPVLALALPLAATLERLQARAMAEAAARPFVRASVARGRSLPEAWRIHAWPVSLAPVLGVYGVVVGALFSGSFVVEAVTAWPGLGRLLVDAINARDIWLVAGCGAAGAAFLAVATLLVDVVHSTIDPRVLGDHS
jgi:ABC-type dipeptide/oligopeptide/nickel transport system permease component